MNDFVALIWKSDAAPQQFNDIVRAIITEHDVKAVVNPANTSLLWGD